MTRKDKNSVYIWEEARVKWDNRGLSKTGYTWSESHASLVTLVRQTTCAYCFGGPRSNDRTFPIAVSINMLLAEEHFGEEIFPIIYINKIYINIIYI